MKVFVVTESSSPDEWYGSYGVYMAVFSTREKAEVYVARKQSKPHNDRTYNIIQEVL